jgi:TetR/AcrR family transcriptional regulator, mexJK operon transcriptional repressor
MILDGARKVFLQKGFAAGSVDDVASSAGVGKQTIYRHYGSKEGLIVGLVEAMCANGPDDIFDSLYELELADALRRQAAAFLDNLLSPESLRLYRAIVAEAERLPQLGHLFYEAGPKHLRAATAQLLAQRFPPDVARVRAETFVQVALGDVYLEAALGLVPADLEQRRARQIEEAVSVALREI